MPHQRQRSCALLVATLPLFGCSLMGLDDFGAAHCTSDADCSKASARLEPSPSACGDAVCRTGLCEWQPAQEICDGKDNDCDGLIDEGLTLPSQASDAVAAESAEIAYVATAERARTFVAVPAAKGPSEGYTFPSAAAHELQYASLAGSSGCPVPNPDTPGGVTAATCNFAELALAADEDHLVVASINTDGCAAGQVRVGLSELSAPFSVWLGKTQVHTGEPSNIAFGVDVDAEPAGQGVRAPQGCTGASRVAGMAALGATRPAVATLGTNANREGGALLLFLGASAGSSSPRSGLIPVEALGLAVSTERPEWLNGMNDGKPVTLGYTTSLSAPAVLALKSPSEAGGKYLVAYPASRDAVLGVQLLTVRVDLNGSKTGLKTDPTDFIADDGADQVLLALGNADRSEVGIVWQAGSGADAQLHFRLVSTSGQLLSRADEQPFLGLSIPVTGLRSAPRLLYRRAGFAENEPTGGWFLSWVDASSNGARAFHIARFRDGDGALEFLGEASRPLAGTPLLYPSEEGDWSVGYASIHTGGDREPETNPLWCK